ncbi:hypothetical protein BDV27DRAFT_138185 [Aspergillus caelatus]|uniref:Zn(2)-C6 fungal-type domain-containing protein n=1 Tax=Aspergillus caelatus TaxID=61420 RepID=A0A5N6ZKH5_9EURO|nr:uncharacterized protein BDV27DRAFT_138185 [Aspergillus caelatus]KAE8358131.1 hypothetical protein BDV27DRAFT_138185 [Aspergillus caelatus]
MPHNPHKKSCIPCRDRHIRCDRLTPTCTNCRKSRYMTVCSYEPIKFKFRTLLETSKRKTHRKKKDALRGTFSPPEEQVHQRSVSPGVQGDAEASRSPSHDQISDRQNIDLQTGKVGHDLEAPIILASQSPLQSSLRDPITTAATVVSPSDFGYLPVATTTFPQISTTTALQDTALHETPCSTSSPHTTSDKLEAFIYSFYIETAGPWLDIVSSNRFFGIYVPRMTVSEPALHSACLAYASQVLYLHGRVPREIKEELHDRALRQLTPTFTSSYQGRSAECLLASTVLLRMTEQFLELGEDHQHHLYGSSTLFETELHQLSLFDDNLRNSSFWAYLRGAIRISFLLERPSPFRLEYLSFIESSRGNGQMSDEAYANCMTYFIAELCTLCWSEPGALGSDGEVASRIHRLQGVINEWKSNLPASFNPWYTDFRENDIFPDVRYLAPWHCVAWQFFYAAQVMIAVYLPAIREQSNVFQLTRTLEENVATPSRWLCGVTLSSNDYGVKINGSHLIAWCGQFLTARTEQNMVLHILLSLWEDTKWPNQTCCTRLKDIWNGSRGQWIDNERPST